MPKIKVTFSDGTEVIFHEEQAFRTIIHNNKQAVLGEAFTLWSHSESGLIPSFLTMLTNGLYFFDIENPDVVYSVQSVVKITEI